MTITEQIRSFITSNFYISEPKSLTDEASLLENRIVDSTGVLEVIGFLESTFGIAIADDEILPENLDSIARIAAYVGRKQG
jgi:acyl carrier protein